MPATFKEFFEKADVLLIVSLDLVDLIEKNLGLNINSFAVKNT